MKGEKNYNKFLVVAKNDAMRAKWPYSELEQKISALIISVINPKDEKFKEYIFKTAQILRLFKMGEKNYENLYRVTENLLRNPITIQTPEGELYQANIIADAYYSKDKSTVRFTIAEIMKGYLLQLQDGQYTKFYLENIIGLSSKHSIAMYRFCKSYEFQKCVTKNIEELKFSLGIDSNEYENFYDFNKWVLKVSQKELEEKTDVKFSYQTETKRKKVIKLTFTINWNPQLEEKLNLAEQLKILAEMNVREKAENVTVIKTEIEKKKASEIRKEITESLNTKRQKETGN
ncbi:MAG: replication initiation protein [Bacteroidales bacterium]|jgi:plasmid replication initiation protein